jgi:hypothetical protein
LTISTGTLERMAAEPGTIGGNKQGLSMLFSLLSAQ